MSADERMQAEMDRAAEAAREWSTQNLADGGGCDFCSRLLVPGRYVTYVLSGLIIGTLSAIGDDLGAGSLQTVDDPYWAACEACDPVVAAGDVGDLVEHVLAHRDRERVGEIPAGIFLLVRTDLGDLYRAFYALEPRRMP